MRLFFVHLLACIALVAAAILPALAAETPGSAQMASSGLEGEISKRIQYWQARGYGLPTATPDGATKTITIQVGDQSIQIDVKVVGKGSTTPVVPGEAGDLSKDLQAAFTDDSAPPPGKETARNALVKVYSDIAKSVLDANFSLGTDKVTTAGGVSLALGSAELNNVNPKALPKTRDVIRRYLVKQAFPAEAAAALTPAIREQFAKEFGAVATALKALK